VTDIKKLINKVAEGEVSAATAADLLASEVEERAKPRARAAFRGKTEKPMGRPGKRMAKPDTMERDDTDEASNCGTKGKKGKRMTKPEMDDDDDDDEMDEGGKYANHSKLVDDAKRMGAVDQVQGGGSSHFFFEDRRTASAFKKHAERSCADVYLKKDRDRWMVQCGPRMTEESHDDEMDEVSRRSDAEKMQDKKDRKRHGKGPNRMSKADRMKLSRAMKKSGKAKAALKKVQRFVKQTEAAVYDGDEVVLIEGEDIDAIIEDLEDANIPFEVLEDEDTKSIGIHMECADDDEADLLESVEEDEEDGLLEMTVKRRSASAKRRSRMLRMRKPKMPLAQRRKLSRAMKRSRKAKAARKAVAKFVRRTESEEVDIDDDTAFFTVDESDLDATLDAIGEALGDVNVFVTEDNDGSPMIAIAIED